MIMTREYVKLDYDIFLTCIIFTFNVLNCFIHNHNNNDSNNNNYVHTYIHIYIYKLK